MARKKKKSLMDYIRLPDLDLDQETKKGIFIIFIFALGAISLLGLFGMAGLLGIKLTGWLESGFGWGRWLVPVLILAWGYVLYQEEKYELRFRNYAGIIIFMLSFQALLLLFIESNKWDEALQAGIGGGYVGFLLANILLKYTGIIVAFIISLALIVLSLCLAFNTTPKGLFGPESYFARALFPLRYAFAKLMGLKLPERDEDEEDDEEESEEGDDEGGDEEENDEEEDENDDDSEEDEEENDEEEDNDDVEENDEEKNEDEEDDEEEPPVRKPAKEDKPEVWWQPSGIKINLPLSLLDGAKGKATSGDTKENQEIIRKTLENFGIPVEMGAISVGPTVTQYTLKPAEGIKLSKITNLSDNLALALAMHPIRIEAPIPGKSLVGVEVPNQSKATVSLKEVLSIDEYRDRKSNLMMALGKDVSGKCLVDNIAKMPHLLVAGATNSGKSVCLNTLIISLLYENDPDDLRLIMVDPKRVELILYNDIPHLLTPVITKVPDTINALKWCLNEMDRRLDLLSQAGKRDIKGYNEAINPRMPYIVFIIDELADLMTVAGREIETNVIRLAQMARATGIHLILATQRPSVDIITGVIKANMPSRIAFSVASSTDSRTILDTVGAEKLLGRGDMLFKNAEMSKPKRLQGAFVGENEIKKVVRYIKERADRKTLYLENVTDRQKVSGIGGYGLNGNNAGDEDELFEEARDVVVAANKAATSLLQRKLRIGYGRAASLLDALEEAGIVGPPNGSKPREVLISKGQLESLGAMGVSAMPLHHRSESKKREKYLDEDEEDDIPPVFREEPIADLDEPSFAEASEDEEDENDDNDEDENEDEEDENDDNGEDEEESEEENEDDNDEEEDEEDDNNENEDEEENDDDDSDEEQEDEEESDDDDEEQDDNKDELSYAEASEDNDEIKKSKNKTTKSKSTKKDEPNKMQFNKFFSR